MQDPINNDLCDHDYFSAWFVEGDKAVKPVPVRICINCLKLEHNTKDNDRDNLQLRGSDFDSKK